LDEALAPKPSAIPSPRGPFAPVAASQRIEALDVVRGFALLGIFLMNIEYFNRPIAVLLIEGMPRDLTGADWLASWFIAYFVQGKFWTIFSLLFGMGFAVMLVRAERAGREFIRVYLRRILALAVIGAVHFIYVWEGDILFSYAVGALGLLIVLYGRARPLLVAGAALAGLGFATDFDLFFAAAGGLAAAALLALYLRGEQRLAWRGVSVPLASFIMMFAGVLIAVAAVVLWLLPDGPIEPRIPLTVLGPLLAVTGWLSWKYHAPAGASKPSHGGGPVRLRRRRHDVDGPRPALRSRPGRHARGGDAGRRGVERRRRRHGASRIVAGSAAQKAKKTRAEQIADVKAEREKQLKELATRKAGRDQGR
jgi:hypothetical protein